VQDDSCVPLEDHVPLAHGMQTASDCSVQAWSRMPAPQVGVLQVVQAAVVPVPSSEKEPD